MLFSFFVYWEPNDAKISVKTVLESYFGFKRVIKCLNRIDIKVIECDSSILKSIDIKANEIKTDETIENYTTIENFIGCLENEIDL